MGRTAILLAAGKSTRMGSLKGLLPWEGKTLFEHQLMSLEKSLIDEIIVVVGYQAENFMKITKEHSIKTVYNQHFQSGKCSSLLAGLRTMESGSDAILVVAVDQPTSFEVINRLLESLSKSEAKIAVPLFNGKRGHPVLFSGSILEDLLSIKEETLGIRSVFQKYKERISEVPINDCFIQLNINTPEDYEAALRRNNSKKIN
jgi:molybdenum cofactor cytidylyltransferase